jgi:hypothetical protein
MVGGAMIGLSHVALAGALAACLAGIGGYVHGTRVGVTQEQAAQARADAAADKARAELQGKIDAVGTAHQESEYGRQVEVREITRESQQIIERPVYRDVCIDADGVGLLDRAAAVANGTASVQPPAGDAGGVAAGPAD